VAKKSKTKPFEELYRRLEEVVAQLESGDLPLEKSLELFEEGMRLSEQCRKALKGAEARLKVLVKDEKGEFTLKDVPHPPATGETEKTL